MEFQVFEERVSDEEILDFIKREEVVTTKEVADEFDYHLQTAKSSNMP